MPQGSVLGPLLFNIYLNDLFFTLNDVCNFADDTTPYVCDLSLQRVLEQLEHHCDLAINWFDCNFMKLNTDKCHLLVSGHKYEKTWIRVGKDKIWEERNVKLLGVTIDNELKFDQHISDICRKANRKLSALLRMSKFLQFEKRRTLYKAFIESQFKYCPLVWMFHSRMSNSKINRLHERALRIVYNDYESSFQSLLEKDSSFSIHHQNIQRLSLEIYKAIHENSVADFDNFLVFRNSINNRSGSELLVPSVNSVLLRVKTQ